MIQWKSVYHIVGDRWLFAIWYSNSLELSYSTAISITVDNEIEIDTANTIKTKMAIADNQTIDTLDA